jgi:hypothetical protein
VFIKTHKTGSSTVTNMLHRFALSNNLRAVMPKDNLFLGWPYLDTLSSVQHYGDTRTYDVFASGHTRYNRGELEQLVPGAEYLTILRDPVAHFVSSWKHWHVADHIYDHGQPAPTMLEFVRNHEKYWPHTKWTDPFLVRNSMAFDLGLDNATAAGQIEALIDRMDREFSLVMITELMDESLVLLRRLLCWHKDDIAYLSLKVTSAMQQQQQQQEGEQQQRSDTSSSPSAIDGETRKYIEAMNAADMKLYRHFKDVLLARIAREVDFESELQEFRTSQAQLRERCVSFGEYEEDRMRKLLLLDSTPAETRACLLYLLDSKGFVKHLKRVHDVPFPECSSANILPLKQLALIDPDPVVTAVFANVAARKAMQVGLGIVIAKSPTSKIDFAKDEFTVVGSNTPDMVLTLPYEGEIRSARRVMPKIRTAYVFMHPLERFGRAWRLHTISETLGDDGKPGVTVLSFVKNPKEYLPLLSSDTAKALDNPMARRFGLREGDKIEDMARIAQLIYDSVDFFLPADKIDQGLVMLRRWMCWSLLDIDFPTASLSELHKSVGGTPDQGFTVATTGGFGKDEQAALQQFLWADIEIYNLLSGLLEKHIETLVSFEDEIEELRARRAQLDASCTHPDPIAAARLSRQHLVSDACQAAALPAEELVAAYTG